MLLDFEHVLVRRAQGEEPHPLLRASTHFQDLQVLLWGENVRYPGPDLILHQTLYLLLKVVRGSQLLSVRGPRWLPPPPHRRRPRHPCLHPQRHPHRPLHASLHRVHPAHPHRDQVSPRVGHRDLEEDVGGAAVQR